MYDDTVKRLRFCATDGRCDKCPLEEDGFCSDNLMTEAADAIEELSIVVRAQKAVLDKFPHWIPVTERLPEEEKTVMTWGKEHQCILLDWMHDNKWCCFGDADYWMPLPEPPEKESDN